MIPTRKVGIFIKALLSGIALLWLIDAIDWSLLAKKVVVVDWLMAGVSFAIFSLWIFPCSLRWRQIANACGYSISINESIRSYLTGAFFSSFLPTGKGGDIVRGVLLARDRHFALTGILSTILVERVIGLLTALSLVLCVLTIQRYSFLTEIRFSILLLCVTAWIMIVFLASPSGRKLLHKLFQKLPINGLKTRVEDFIKVIDICFGKPLLIASAIGFSFLNQLVLISSGILTALAIPGFDVPWTSFFLIIPLNFIAVLLPSIGGYGVREATFIIFFGWLGVSREMAGLFAIIQLLFFWFFSFAGACCFVFRKSGV